MTLVAVAPDIVNTDSKVLVGLAVPCGEPSLVADRIGEQIVVFREQWDADSCDLPAGTIPLLCSHLESHPIGKGRLWQTETGVEMEGLVSP